MSAERLANISSMLLSRSGVPGELSRRRCIAGLVSSHPGAAASSVLGSETSHELGRLSRAALFCEGASPSPKLPLIVALSHGVGLSAPSLKRRTNTATGSAHDGVAAGSGQVVGVGPESDSSASVDLECRVSNGRISRVFRPVGRRSAFVVPRSSIAVSVSRPPVGTRGPRAALTGTTASAGCGGFCETRQFPAFLF